METLLLKLLQRRLGKTLRNMLQGTIPQRWGDGKDDLILVVFISNLRDDFKLKVVFIIIVTVILILIIIVLFLEMLASYQQKRHSKKFLLVFRNSPIFPCFSSLVYYT